ncbi:hypothetical protein EN836_26740 [Mesorhizobium sp. M1C.F.Ca.ET.193.01.1.1]|uniref:hypothetical protein n=1 Tax=unclassified Mesorhizobium TaxID=325217 RepID=UPI000FD4AB46|nr:MULTISPECIES: hypothetical protein [unclassified Mesorhizobium]TGS93907.1 hypothetical protein EN820_47405 [bacterium M00.F.Ca.ET.177.01.1.1]TGQ50972.1 hypothetical protein EN853_26735 [Mesorhizobium sp. M1C.F.Ca.ET.210.01.1.1]TGQ66409.1 hypothetical protein EN855_026745 [Mesorhizobium sp. M1C.F.Ca.ET.212.01.1.1]TGR00495.1 hypothetical protein EN847_26735 [Mesorhizobium sp. M1C.F.Ca.ET.204.01.1.1]TGR21086.1 hypothetical protein EN839_26735 [Mesorhizobium sp. M1C.F.Ca.ET.196.01.1.1]
MTGDDRQQISQKVADVELLARRLAKETAISQDEARELIKLIGADWPSLLREAQFLKAGTDRPAAR